MTQNEDTETQRQQAQAERDFIAARDQLAEQDAAARQAELEQQGRTFTVATAGLGETDGLTAEEALAEWIDGENAHLVRHELEEADGRVILNTRHLRHDPETEGMTLLEAGFSRLEATTHAGLVAEINREDFNFGQHFIFDTSTETGRAALTEYHNDPFAYVDQHSQPQGKGWPLPEQQESGERLNTSAFAPDGPLDMPQPAALTQEEQRLAATTPEHIRDELLNHAPAQLREQIEETYQVFAEDQKTAANLLGGMDAENDQASYVTLESMIAAHKSNYISEGAFDLAEFAEMRGQGERAAHYHSVATDHAIDAGEKWAIAEAGPNTDGLVTALYQAGADGITSDYETALERGKPNLAAEYMRDNTPPTPSPAMQEAEEARLAEQQPEALTLEAIERDPMNAVRMSFPKDAAPELVEAAEYATFFAEQWSGDGQIAEAASDRRRGEIGDRIYELYGEDAPGFVPDMDSMSPQQKHDWHVKVDEKFPAIAAWRGEMISALEREGNADQQPEALTLEAIERDPWNAVRLDIPQDADKVLLEATFDKAAACEELLHSASEWADQEGKPRVARNLWELGDYAEHRAIASERLLANMDEHGVDLVQDLQPFVPDDGLDRLTAAPTDKPWPTKGSAVEYIEQVRTSRDEPDPDHTPEPGGPGSDKQQPEALTFEGIEQAEPVNENFPLTLEALAEHPAHVLDRTIPADSSDELLLAAYEAAGKVRKFAATADLGGDETRPYEAVLAAFAENVQEGIGAVLESRGVPIPPNPDMAANQNNSEHLAPIAGTDTPQEQGAEAEQKPAGPYAVHLKNGRTFDNLDAAEAVDLFAHHHGYRLESGEAFNRLHASSDGETIHTDQRFALYKDGEFAIVGNTYEGLAQGVVIALEGEGISMAAPEIEQAKPMPSEQWANMIGETEAELRFATDNDQQSRSDILADRLDGLQTQAALGAPIAAFLNKQNHDFTPREIEEIAYTAAENNVLDRHERGRGEIALDGLNDVAGRESVAAMTDYLTSHRISDDADLYLVHRINKAAEGVLEDKTSRDAEPWERDELEELAAVKAREIEAKGLLHEMTRDREEAPERGPDGPNGPGSGPDNRPPNDPPTPPSASVETSGPDLDPDGPGGTPHSAALTLEAMQRDPWNAVTMPIPDGADCDLLERIGMTADDCASAVMEKAELGPYDRAAQAFAAADGRCAEVEGRLEQLACLEQPEAIDMDRTAREPGDNSTPWGQLETDLAARIGFLEGMTGRTDHPDQRAYAEAQAGMSEQISATADPAERAGLRREKNAQSQDYAASLCETGYLALGADGQYESASSYQQEAALRREIAGNLRGPEITPPDHDPERREQIGRDMAAVAAEVALGRTARTETVVQGPNVAEQQGQEIDPHDIKGQPGKGDYAALRAETAARAEPEQEPVVQVRPVLEDYDDPSLPKPYRPEKSRQKMPVYVPGAGLVTVDQPGNGTRRDAAVVALAAEVNAMNKDGSGEVSDARAEDAAQLFDQQEKVKREVPSSVEASAVSAARDVNAEPSDRTLSRIERAQQAAEREEAHERESGRDAGRAMGGGREM